MRIRLCHPRRPRPRGVTFIAASGCLLLTACGGGDSADDPADDASTSSFRPSSTVPTTPGPDGTIRPGAVLGWGTEARASYFLDDFDTTVRGSVSIKPMTPPRQVPARTLPDIVDPGEARVAYEVRWRVTNEGTTSLDVSDVTPRSTDATGSSMSSARTTDGPCHVPPDASDLNPGSWITMCSYVYAGEQAEPVTVEYSDDGRYDDAPISWRLP